MIRKSGHRFSEKVMRQLNVRRLSLIAALAAALAAPGASAQKGPSTVALNPGFGDLMQLLIQPRHLKLGLAARAGNWALADYEVKLLRQSFANIAKTYPMFRGQPISVTVDAILDDPLKSASAAIDKKDSKAFDEAYERITAGCNACHSALDHPFVVIKVPTEAAFPNQEFKPAK